MSDQTAASADARPNLATGVRPHRTFFVGFAGALLVMLLVGFGPTLYLRAFFDVPPVPTYVLVHGAVLTSWFVWFFIQTSLVAVHRTDLHRRLGIVGIVIGVAVLAASAMASLGMIPRIRAAGFDIEANIAELAMGVWINLSNAIVFAVLVALAFAYRRQSQRHKRLMLLASISMAGPAVARFARYPEVGVGNPTEFVFFFGGYLVLLLVLVVYDVLAQKRLHPVTMWGAPFVVVTPALFAFLIGPTAFGQSAALLLD